MVTRWNESVANRRRWFQVLTAIVQQWTQSLHQAATDRTSHNLTVKRIFCRCSHMPHVEMTLQGINRFMVVFVPAHEMQALPAVRPRSFGYMVILINFTVWHTLMLSPNGSARCLTTNGLIGCYSLNLSMVLCRENLKRRVVYGLVFVG